MVLVVVVCNISSYPVVLLDSQLKIMFALNIVDVQGRNCNIPDYHFIFLYFHYGLLFICLFVPQIIPIST